MNTLESLSGINVLKTAWIALLDKLIPGIPKSSQKCIFFYFLASKIAIAKLWKTSVVCLDKLSWIIHDQ